MAATTQIRDRAPTIIDVAEKAGVAIGTVSRFLNGETARTAAGLAKPEIARKVAAAVASLQIEPLMKR